MPEEAVGLSSDESVVEMWHPIKVFFRCRAFFQVFLALPNIYDSLQLDEIASSSCFLSFFSKIRLLCPSDCAKVFSTLFFWENFPKKHGFFGRIHFSWFMSWLNVFIVFSFRDTAALWPHLQLSGGFLLTFQMPNCSFSARFCLNIKWLLSTSADISIVCSLPYLSGFCHMLCSIE